MTLNEKLFTAGPVVEHEGRFFITAGNEGFNSTRNNAGGWSTKKAATSQISRIKNHNAMLAKMGALKGSK